MTISTPSLPADSLTSGNPTCADADLLASLGAANTPAGQTPADAAPADATGFAGLLPAADAPEPVTPAPVSNEQAAAFAAALLWTPAPLLVETVPAAGLTCASGQPTTAEVTTDTNTPDQPESAAGPAIGRAPISAAKFAAPEVSAGLPVRAGQNSPAQAVAQPVVPVVVAQVAVAGSPVAVAVVPAATENVATSGGETVNEPVVPTEAPAVSEPEAPGGRPALRAPGSKEKIAAPAGRSPKGFASHQSVEAKTFLSVTQQVGRGAVGIVGTSVAKTESTMPSAPVLPPPAAENPAALPVLAVPAGSHGLATQVTLPEITATVTSDPAVQARDAVAAVMQVVNAQEQPAAGAARVVNLDFNFGADRLAVRVEQLRDGTVQAHFRTDSHELRAALAHEWQQAAAAPENILRFAEPVYQAAARGDQSANFGASADGSASQQGQARPQQQQAASEFSARPARAGTRPLSVTTTTEAPRVRASSSARHLQAVA